MQGSLASAVVLAAASSLLPAAFGADFDCDAVKSLLPQAHANFEGVLGEELLRDHFTVNGHPDCGISKSAPLNGRPLLTCLLSEEPLDGTLTTKSHGVLLRGFRFLAGALHTSCLGLKAQYHHRPEVLGRESTEHLWEASVTNDKRGPVKVTVRATVPDADRPVPTHRRRVRLYVDIQRDYDLASACQGLAAVMAHARSDFDELKGAQVRPGIYSAKGLVQSFKTEKCEVWAAAGKRAVLHCTLSDGTPKNEGNRPPMNKASLDFLMKSLNAYVDTVQGCFSGEPSYSRQPGPFPDTTGHDWYFRDHSYPPLGVMVGVHAIVPDIGSREAGVHLVTRVQRLE